MIYPHLYKLTLLKALILLILLVLLGIIFYTAWQSGFKEKEKKITNEIAKMKARDIQK
ncbi:hypothetical protein [Enterococcus faecium]|uniref:hypothetical protein n=1 Tax=Enterococcus faecium TaxID=1352 RepID=UPI0023B3011A|nr:hypothetical protein [Enterococcus faecium]